MSDDGWAGGRGPRSPVLLDDLMGQLLWPKLLRAYRLAAAPGRVLMCLGLIVLVGVVDRFYAKVASETLPGGPLQLIGSRLGREVGDIARVVATPWRGGIVDAKAGGFAFYNLFVGQPLAIVREHWPAAVIMFPLLAIGLAITGGAVSRSVACEVSLGATLPWRKAAAFAFRKVLALIAALVGPILIIWLIAAAIAGLGHLLFNWNWTSVVGAAVYGLFLAGGVVLVVLMVGYVLGGAMLVPALACEGTDSFDAVQRAYAYVIARPGRLIVYLMIAALVLGASIIAAWTLVYALLTVTALLTGAPEPTVGGATGMLLKLWIAVPVLLLGAYVLSLIFTLSTIVYLLMRRLVDGQDVSELYMPDDGPIPPQAAAPTATGADYT